MHLTLPTIVYGDNKSELRRLIVSAALVIVLGTCRSSTIRDEESNLPFLPIEGTQNDKISRDMAVFDTNVGYASTIMGSKADYMPPVPTWERCRLRAK